MIFGVLSCSKKQEPHPSGGDEEIQLQLTADNTTVETGAEVRFTVTAKEQTITDADLYIDGQKANGYQHTFDEAGEVTAVAKKNGFKDSAPITIIVEAVSENVDIYVLGFDEKPLYWKNGEPNVFDHEAVGDMIFSRMAVANDKVYVAGERIYSSSRATAFSWFDGSFEELSESNRFASGQGVYVADGHMYVGGFKNESSYVTSVVYWKDGELVTVARGALGSTGGGSIAVKGDDVYIAGMLDGQPMYWKNDVGVPLGGGTGNVIVTDIAIADNDDVYVSGYTIGTTDLAVYWKNGENITLGTGDGASQATAIFVEQNDVYVAGWESITRSGGSGRVRVARYWKNGEAVDLTGGTHQAEANGVFVLDGKVYVSGVEFLDRQSATYWVDGETVRLSHENNKGYAGDIVVVRRSLE